MDNETFRDVPVPLGGREGNLHRPRAVLGRVHPAAVGHELQHLLVAAAGIRHVAQREDLPQQYPERPAGGEEEDKGRKTEDKRKVKRKEEKDNKGRDQRE